MRTVVGTMALFATWYPLPSTSMAKASGNSSSESRCRNITTATTARISPEPMIIHRRPPMIRSRYGPTSGATTANGAMVSRR